MKKLICKIFGHQWAYHRWEDPNGRTCAGGPWVEGCRCYRCGEGDIPDSEWNSTIVNTTVKENTMKTLDWQTLREDGYVQEVNRYFFHPLGLALAINIDDQNNSTLLVLDARDDPEGFNFHDTVDLAPKAAKIKQISNERAIPRLQALGYWVQPIKGSADRETT